jgi:transcriptional regulator with XRE-family HTH domain
MKNNGLNNKSERQLARLAGVSRTSLRSVNEGIHNPTLKTLRRISAAKIEELQIIQYPINSEMDSTSSVVAVSLKTHQEGFDSWKIHFFDLVDELKRSKDCRLLVLPPIKALDKKLSALLAAMTLELSNLYGWEAPSWATQFPPLEKAWFVSGSSSLRASALLESPLRFKLKNIFVLENFLNRT